MSIPQLYALFPTPVYFTNLEPKDINIPQQMFHSKFQTLDYKKQYKGNYVTIDTNILDRSEFVTLKSTIEKHLNIFFKDILKYNKNEIYITSSWVNITPNAHQHASHIHINSLISGVYYLDVPVGAAVKFQKPLLPCLQLVPEQYNEFTALTWDIPVETGKLIMFPSEIYHGVQENSSEEIRISLAFNTFIRGPIGELDKTSFVEIK